MELRHPADLATLIPDADQADPHFMRAVVDTLKQLARLDVPAPPAEPQLVPIARLAQTRMPFGQYLGQSLDDVPLHYLEWLVVQQEDFYRDLRAYLKHPDLESRRRGCE